MDDQPLWFYLLSVLTSGLIASIASALITNRYNGRLQARLEKSQNEKLIKEQKLEVFNKFVGNRNYITGTDFSEALNRINTVFHDDPNVLTAVRNFRSYFRS